MSEFELGDRAVDREEEEDRRTPVVVVGHRQEPARNIHVEAIGTSVALLNQDYSPDANVVDVVYEPAVADALDVWEFVDPERLTRVVDDHGLTIYSFPEPRLKKLDADADKPDVVTDGGFAETELAAASERRYNHE